MKVKKTHARKMLIIFKTGLYSYFNFFRFLATGDTYYTIGHSYRLGFSTVSSIVQEVCQSICNRMETIYMPEPTEEIWKESAKKFETSWNFPNCVGSLDGKHVTIKCPKKVVLTISATFTNFRLSLWLLLMQSTNLYVST